MFGIGRMKVMNDIAINHAKKLAKIDERLDRIEKALGIKKLNEISYGQFICETSDGNFKFVNHEIDYIEKISPVIGGILDKLKLEIKYKEEQPESITLNEKKTK